MHTRTQDFWSFEKRRRRTAVPGGAALTAAQSDLWFFPSSRAPPCARHIQGSDHPRPDMDMPMEIRHIFVEHTDAARGGGATDPSCERIA